MKKINGRFRCITQIVIICIANPQQNIHIDSTGHLWWAPVSKLQWQIDYCFWKLLAVSKISCDESFWGLAIMYWCKNKDIILQLSTTLECHCRTSVHDKKIGVIYCSFGSRMFSVVFTNSSLYMFKFLNIQGGPYYYILKEAVGIMHK